MNSRLNLRLEAARLAAQLSPTSAADLVKQAKTIEKYLLGKAQLPERFNEEDIIRKTVHEAMLEMTGANDVIRKLNEMDKDFHEKYKDCTLPQDKTGKDSENTNTESKEDLYVFSNGLVLRKPHSETPHDNVETNPFLPDPPLSETMLGITTHLR